MSLDEVGHILEEWFSKAEKIVIIGVGNPLRIDDAVGVEVIHKLEGKVSDKVHLIEGETIPENYIEPISDSKPTHILIVDAALAGMEPGVVKFVEDCGTSRISVSTHSLPIQLFCGYLLKTTDAKIGMLLIQPKEVDFGEGLTPLLEKTADSLAERLLRIPCIGQG